MHTRLFDGHVVAPLIAALVVVAAPDSSSGETGHAQSASTAASQGDTSAESAHGLDVGVGVRVGGVGFRHAENGKLDWTDCRMDGTGVFATLDFHRNFFAELSVDYYHALGKSVASGMDRLSLYVLGAAGARFLPDAIVTPYAQVGIGPEWTRVEVGGESRSSMFAIPFLGIGGELNLDSLKLGSNIRTYAMQVPDHRGHGSAGGRGGYTEGVGLKLESAAQVQFFARWEF